MSLVLRTIRGVDEREFVPHISVTFGVLLGVASIGVLIYFIHHVAISIQVAFIVKTVSHDLHAAIDRLFPEELGHGQSAREIGPIPLASGEPVEHATQEVRAQRSGYVQAIDNDRLLELASEHDLVIEVVYRPGRFVVEGTVIASFAPHSRSDEAIVKSINETFIIARERTSTQDVEFAVSQLVEVALRALSPGINDPFTAVSCIRWLAVGLSQLASRSLPSERRFDSDGHLRVIADPVTFAGVADIAFNQIRQAGRSHPVIATCLLTAITSIAERAKRAEDVQSLVEHAELVWQSAHQGLLEGSDRIELERIYHRAQRVLKEGRTR